MIVNYIQFFSEFETEFEELKNSITNPIIQAQELVRFSESRIKTLNKWLRKFKFETHEQEIHFFKVLKPSLVSKIIYYTCLLKTESTLPVNKRQKIKYYNKKLDQIHDFIEQNNQFLIYYRSKSTACDHEYFIRKPFVNNFDQNDLAILNFDEKISTSHDYLMAKMIACDMQTVYLEKSIRNCKKKEPDDFVSPFTWTGTQTEFVEFVYALYHSKVVNKGNICIKEFSLKVANFFNVEINSAKVYDTYQKIKARKTNQTKFLDRATECFFHAVFEQSFR